MHRIPLLLISLALFVNPLVAFAQEPGAEHATEHGGFGTTFLWLALLLIVSKLGALVERIKQPPVLGELVMGILLGALALFGFQFVDVIKADVIIQFLAELGVVLLLFQIGLETNIKEMGRVGLPSFLVAIIGVVVPFLLGTFVVGPWLFPDMDKNGLIFLGATLTATSVGITARVFQDLKKTHIREAKIVLGAAVIDDVLGLLILAVVAAIATTGTVSVSEIAVITLKAVGFLVAAVGIGSLIAKPVSAFFSRIHSGHGMKFAFALCTALFFAYLASLVGLAPIVGAFAAGLILDPVHFKAFDNPHFVTDIRRALMNVPDSGARQEVEKVISHHSDMHVENFIAYLGHFLVPIFFVYTGMQVDLSTLADPKVLLIALAVTAVAAIGKIVAGVASGPGANKLTVGVGMIPRGEVGLIFATVGKQLEVVSDTVFSVIVIMVMLTTLLTPPFLTVLLNRLSRES